MTNPDNAGGLPELPESPYLMCKWHQTSDMKPDEAVIKTTQTLYTEEMMRAYGELCRAAPAGGDWHKAVLGACMQVDGCYVEADPALSIRQLTQWWYDLGKEVTPPDPKDSAPAGSGEVGHEVIALVDALIDAVWDEADSGVRGTHAEAVKAGKATELAKAALLRKLQQGADGELDALRLIRDQWLEENGPGGWIDELRNAVDRANALADRWDHIYGRFADELRSALEGGNADH